MPGRPKSEDPKRPLSLSLRSSTLEAVERKAAAANMSPNAFLALDVERRHGRAEAPTTVAPGCPHPKASEQKVMAGKSVMLVRCGECGGRIR